jgi:hypothetical protein
MPERARNWEFNLDGEVSRVQADAAQDDNPVRVEPPSGRGGLRLLVLTQDAAEGLAKGQR